MPLDNQVVFVTGGSGGLGRRISLHLARAGAAVAVGYLDGKDRADAVSAEIRAADGQAEPIRIDQTDEASIAEAIESAREKLGGLDGLVNNAAMAKGVPFPDLDGLATDIWDATMRTNLRGPWLVARAAAPHLKASGRGRIVNVAAMAGMKPMGASIAQSVGKAGLIQLTRCLAVALAPSVTVNCVAPGLMEGTELTKNMSDAFRDGFKSQSVLDATTSLDDVARHTVAFFESDTTTGQTLVIDGGVYFH